MTPSTYGARAATVKVDDPFSGTVLQGNRDAMIVAKFGITLRNMEEIFFSPTAYNDAFEEYLDMKCFYLTSHPAGGMHFFTEGEHLMLQHLANGLPCAKIRDWCSQLKGAWLISVNDSPVLSVKDIHSIFDKCFTSGSPHCTLLFSHPDVHHGLTNEGIPQISLDQLDPRMMLHGFTPPTPSLFKCNHIQQIWDGRVLHYITKAQCLTRGKLIKQDDWSNRNSSEFTQLDQYKAQGMFGTLQIVTSDNAVFNLVWTYMIKDVNKCKKVQCTCNG